MDGTDVEEFDLGEGADGMLSLTVAQRYSVLVTARNDTNGSNWAIHGNMDTDTFDTVPDDLNASMPVIIDAVIIPDTSLICRCYCANHLLLVLYALRPNYL